MIKLLGRRAVIPMDGDAHVPRDHTLDAEAGIDIERALKRSDEETGRRKQHDGRCNLRDNERAAQPRSPLAALNTAGLERACEIDGSCVEARNNASNERRAEDNHADDRQHDDIHAKGNRCRNPKRAIDTEKARRPERDECSDDSGSTTQDHAFDEELSHETRAARANSHPRCNFACASGRASEEHPCGIRRGDHKHQERDGEKHRDELLQRALQRCRMSGNPDRV